MFKRLLFVWTATLFLSVSAFAQQRGFYFVANTAPPDDFLSLRTLPSSVAGQRIATLPNGTLLQVLQRQSDGWWYVRVVSTGQQGWALSGQGNKTWIDCCRTANTAQASNSEQGANDNAQDAPITDCDTYAASDQDPQRKAVGVSTSNINSVLAIPACEAAVREHPNSSRLVYQLGRAYYKANNFGAAVAQFRRAAEQGYALAQTNLGAMYAFGQGIPKDDAQAVAWFRKAADQGNAGAQADLGQMYRDGRGVPQNEVQAVVLYGKAAEQGYAPAQNSLGDMYERGRGVPQDYRQAAAWYRKAADQGLAGAQANLARVQEHLAAAEQEARRNAELENAKREAERAEQLRKSEAERAKRQLEESERRRVAESEEAKRAIVESNRLLEVEHQKTTAILITLFLVAAVVIGTPLIRYIVRQYSKKKEKMDFTDGQIQDSQLNTANVTADGIAPASWNANDTFNLVKKFLWSDHSVILPPKAVVIGAIAFLAYGLLLWHPTPDCDAASSTVVEILQEKVKQLCKLTQFCLPNFNPSIDNIRTVARDPETKNVQCRADLHLNLPLNLGKDQISEMINTWLNSGSIAYTVERTSEGDLVTIRQL